jgi:hypothetical protein
MVQQGDGRETLGLAYSGKTATWNGRSAEGWHKFFEEMTEDMYENARKSKIRERPEGLDSTPSELPKDERK